MCSRQSYHHTNTTLYNTQFALVSTFINTEVFSFIVLIMFCGLDFMVHGEEITDKSGTKYSRESIQINRIHMHIYIYSSFHHTFIYTCTLTYPHIPTGLDIYFSTKAKSWTFCYQVLDQCHFRY